MRRYQELLIIRSSVIVLQKIEDLINVLANHGICRQKSEVCVESRSLFVEVTRPDVAVTN